MSSSRSESDSESDLDSASDSASASDSGSDSDNGVKLRPYDASIQKRSKNVYVAGLKLTKKKVRRSFTSDERLELRRSYLIKATSDEIKIQYLHTILEDALRSTYLNGSKDTVFSHSKKITVDRILDLKNKNLRFVDYLYHLMAEHSALIGKGIGVVDTLFKTGGENTLIAFALHECIKAAGYHCNQLGFSDELTWDDDEDPTQSDLQAKYKCWAMESSRKLLAYIDERERSLFYKVKVWSNTHHKIQSLLQKVGQFAHRLVFDRLNLEFLVNRAQLYLELQDLRDRFSACIYKFFDETRAAEIMKGFDSKLKTLFLQKVDAAVQINRQKFAETALRDITDQIRDDLKTKDYCEHYTKVLLEFTCNSNNRSEDIDSDIPEVLTWDLGKNSLLKEEDCCSNLIGIIESIELHLRNLLTDERAEINQERERVRGISL